MGKDKYSYLSLELKRGKHQSHKFPFRFKHEAENNTDE